MFTSRTSAALVTTAAVAGSLFLAVPAKAVDVNAPGHVYAGSTSQGGAAVVEVSKAGRVTMMVAWTGDCQSGTPAQQWQGVRNLRVKRGKFKAHVSTPDVDFAASGTIGKKRATGSWHATVHFRDSSGNVTDTCDSGTVHWSLPSSGWGGQQSGLGYPAAIMPSRRGTAVAEIDLPYEAACSSGQTFGGLASMGGFPIARSGSFGDDWRDTEDLGGGQRATIDRSLHGKFGKSAARGTFAVTATITDATGAVVDTCKTGTLTWKARR